MEDKKINSRIVDNKQERRTMKSKGVEGLPADPQESLAANEDFSGTEEEAFSRLRSESGWDPYDVWRTRVKMNSSKEREADPRL